MEGRNKKSREVEESENRLLFVQRSSGLEKESKRVAKYMEERKKWEMKQDCVVSLSDTETSTPSGFTCSPCGL